jgi:D-arabinose 1-dehydrogenase-like Zn-dependent alcohol dehydrogenase
VKGIYVGSADMQKQFHAALEQNGIHRVIDLTFNFDQVREAYEYLQSGQHLGKIVIQLD